MLQACRWSFCSPWLQLQLKPHALPVCRLRSHAYAVKSMLLTLFFLLLVGWPPEACILHLIVVDRKALMMMPLASQHTNKLVLTKLCAHVGVDPPASTARGHMERICLVDTMRAAAACSRLQSPKPLRCGLPHDLQMVHVTNVHLLSIFQHDNSCKHSCIW